MQDWGSYMTQQALTALVEHIYLNYAVDIN